ncbi:MAG: hypothetical protein V1874_04340 [Spirochaetota bacterium]
MLYILLGLLAGILLSFAPIWGPAGAIEIFPEWHGSIESVRSIEESRNPLMPKAEFPLVVRSDIFLVSANGKFLKKINFDNRLASVCSNGSYYVQYDKIGDHAELFNPSGDRFWRIKSMEYPYITSGGKLVLLMNGDHTKIRIIDIDGNPAGIKEISGTLCTVIALQQNSDYAGVGFMDGNYYILNDRGDLITGGIVADKAIVKNIAISPNGRYSLVHYGSSKGDFLKSIDASRDKSYDLPLKHVHLTRTALNINDNGEIAAIDYDRIIIGEEDEVESIIKIPASNPGLSSISCSDGVYSAGYMDVDGKAHFFIFLNNGILYQKKFSNETFIDSRIIKNIFIIRGSQGLFCYSFYKADK